MVWTYIIIAVLLVVAELVYFKVADHFNIIDKPNERSSHTKVVLRGGGIIFSIALMIWMIWKMVNGEWVMVNDHWPLVVAVLLTAIILQVVVVIYLHWARFATAISMWVQARN